MWKILPARGASRNHQLQVCWRPTQIERYRNMKTKIQKKSIIALCGLLLFLASPLAYAKEATSGDDAWQFHVIPYIWMAGISGHVTVKGSRASVDDSFSDILENLDFAGFLHLEAAKGKWALFGDGTYVKLSVDRTLIDVGSELVQVELGGAYRFAELPLGKEGGRLLSFEALAGGRYNYVKSEVEILSLLKSKESQDWVDPIVGLRVECRGCPGISGIAENNPWGWVAHP
jgi:hypothetical protein